MKRTEPGSALIADQWVIVHVQVLTSPSAAALSAEQMMGYQAGLPRYCTLSSAPPPSPCTLWLNWPLLYKMWRSCISLWASHCRSTAAYFRSCWPALSRRRSTYGQSVRVCTVIGGVFHVISPMCQLPHCEWSLRMNGFECIMEHVADCSVTAREGAPCTWQHRSFVHGKPETSVPHTCAAPARNSSLCGWGLCSLAANSFSQRWLLTLSNHWARGGFSEGAPR